MNSPERRQQVGSQMVRRVGITKYEPPRVDRRPDKVLADEAADYRDAGVRALLFLLKQNKVPARRVISAAFYPKRRRSPRA